MSLLTWKLSGSFTTSSAAEKGTMCSLETIGIVGVESMNSDHRLNYDSDVVPILYSSEEHILLAIQNPLAEQGYQILSESMILTCDLNNDSDFLKGAFKDAHLDLLVLSSLFYDPDDNKPIGQATRQSSFANDSDKWLGAFEESNAKAILNTWFGFDKPSGCGLSRLIAQTTMYESVYYAPIGFASLGKGAELFLRC